MGENIIMSDFMPKPQVGNFTVTPAGTFVARCCQVIYLGQHEETYMGKPKGLVPKLRVAFELPTELHDFGQGKQEPFLIGREYSLYLNDNATLRKHAESWRGEKYTPAALEKFDPRRFIGQPALINIVHNNKPDGKKVAKIENVSQLVKGMICPPAVLEPIVYSVLEGQQAPNFAKLPDWIKEKCMKCFEWRPQTPEEHAAEEESAGTPVAENAPPDDDRPF
jgi:hypothetical protein